MLGVITRVLLDAHARGAGARGIVDGRTRSITAFQRAGGGHYINPQFLTLVLDGVFREAEAGGLEFHPAPGPSGAEVAGSAGGSGDCCNAVGGRPRTPRRARRIGSARSCRCWPGS